jgi:ribosomal protein S18 acetylase RimI-like enzyme
MARLNTRRGITSLERCCRGNNSFSPVCHYAMKNQKQSRGLHRLQPGLSKMVLVIALFVCACLNASCAFVPAHEFRPTRRTVSLDVVETKTRSAVDTTSTIPVPITHHHTTGPNNSDSLFILSSADDEEEEKTEPPQPEENTPETSAQSSETTAEDAPVEEDEGQKAQRLVTTAKAAALLARRKGVSSGGAAVRKTTTSVGERRVGSATQARTGARSKDQLLNAIRKAALANTAQDESSSKENDKPLASIPHGPEHYKKPSSKLTTSAIHATVTEMLDQACRRTTGSMGLFGDTSIDDFETHREPLPGTILAHPIQKSREAKATDRLTVRVATPSDHLDIANLRLSVFSDFSAEMRKTFCSRSLQVLSNRQNRGATCIVATVPRYGSMLSPRPDIILGSAECSDHEFLSTILGLRRPPESILYITEVAVNPTARRKGIGYKMMEVSTKLDSTCLHSICICFVCF